MIAAKLSSCYNQGWPPGGASVPFKKTPAIKYKSNNNPGQEFYPKITHGLIFKMFVTTKKKTKPCVRQTRCLYFTKQKIVCFYFLGDCGKIHRVRETFTEINDYYTY